MKNAPRRAVFLVVAAAACDAGAPPPDGGPPLMERAARGTLKCEVTRGRTDHSPRVWNTAPAMVQTSAGTVFLVRPESTLTLPSFILTKPQLVASTLAIDGAIGASTVVPSMPSDVGNVAAAPRADGFAAVYVEGMALRFAAFDAAGAIVVAPKTIVSGVDPFMTLPAMAAGPDGGFGVVFSVTAADGRSDVRLAALSADGDVRGAPRSLIGAGQTIPYVYPSVAIVSDGDGYAMVWTNAADLMGGIDFAKADASGAQTVARRRISVTRAARKFVGDALSLLAVEGGYLAAWTEQDRGPVNKDGVVESGASGEVRIVRLDPRGAAALAPVPLRAAETDVDEIEPVLVRLSGGAAAIAWGRGSHIYFCAGCVPDHRIDLLPIDPVDLTPLGDVVSLTNGAASPTEKAGGLLDKRIAVVGDTLLTTYQLQFHTSAKPSSAAFTCKSP